MTTTSATPTLAQIAITNHSVEESAALVLPDMEALPSEKVRAANFDVTAATSTLLGYLPKIQAMREEIVEKLGFIDISCVDRLPDFISALIKYNADYNAVNSAPDNLKALAEQGDNTRNVLSLDINSMVGRGLMDNSSMKNLKGLSGYKNIAGDLQILTSIFEANWKAICTRCSTRQEELAAARDMAKEISRLVGYREANADKINLALDRRNRAFTVLMDAYDQVCRAVECLLWNSRNAESVVPNLYGGNRHKQGQQEDEKVPETVAEPSPAPVLGKPSKNLPDSSPFLE